MSFYAWKIRYTGRQTVERVTELPGLANALLILGLPGAVSPSWLIASAQVLEQDGQTEVICNENGPDEWRLTWTKIDVASCHVG